MASLTELVERVNKGELIDSDQLEVYEESANSAEKFLAHHAHATLDLRRAQQHMLQSLEAIDYSDQKVLNQFVAIGGFLGQTDLRAAPVIRFGSSAIARREYALGLEALANGVSFDLQHSGSFTSDRDNCLCIAAQYERAAQSIGWSRSGSSDWSNEAIHVGVIVSNLVDDEAATRALLSLAKHHDRGKIKLHVYSTESGVRRDRQFFAGGTFVPASVKRGIATLESLGQKKVSAWIASTDGDIVSSAKALADQLVRDQIDVAIFDTTQADAVAAVVASWEIAQTKINLCRRSPLFSPAISTVIYTDQARLSADRDWWSKRGVETRAILEGIDIAEIPATGPSRGSYGIPENAVVLASAGTDLDRTVSEEFVEAIIGILRAHPQAIYLIAGEGELAWQKRKFETAGVGKRVGYAGKRKDLHGFLRITDLYLAEFPSAGTSGLLQAMSVERAVVALAGTEAAEIAGEAAATALPLANSFLERVSKLIADPAQREWIGKSMRQRIEQQFAFTQTARSIETICEQTFQQSQSTDDDSATAVAA